jgi:dolichol kinase
LLVQPDIHTKTKSNCEFECHLVPILSDSSSDLAGRVPSKSMKNKWSVGFSIQVSFVGLSVQLLVSPVLATSFVCQMGNLNSILINLFGFFA